MISRAEAKEIALSDAMAHGLGHSVLSVLCPDEIPGQEPKLYNVDLSDCWIAYVESPGPLALRSSTIVAIRCADGSVIYRGSANDEG